MFFMSLMKMVCHIINDHAGSFILSSCPGNGEIDFEEFLTLMTSTEKFLENLRGKWHSFLE